MRADRKQIKFQILSSANILFEKLKAVDIKSLNISDYTKSYLQKYIEDYNFYAFLYCQLFLKILDKNNKPSSDSVFVDYGGGCGILSYLAKEIGFYKIIYSDIFLQSVEDSKIIAEKLGIKIDFFIHGDIELFVETINNYNIKPDVICSFDVLEHIYNPLLWFEKIKEVDANFLLFSMTSANGKNPFINYKFKKIHKSAENQNQIITSGWKKHSTNLSFLSERKKIILQNFADLSESTVNDLAIKTRGLKIEDIKKVVEIYITTKNLIYTPSHPTNTCDPYTGNRTENIIDTNNLQKYLLKLGYQAEITNSYWSFSNKKIFNLFKFFLNILIFITGKYCLFFSPSYTVELIKE